MLGAFVLIFIGVAFFRLAKKHNQPHAWIYSLFSVLSWVLGVLLGGLILFFTYPRIIHEDKGLFAITLLLSGFLTTIIFYFLLKNYFLKKTQVISKQRDDLLD